MKKRANYKNVNWQKAHDYFGLKKGDNLVLHHIDVDMINKDINRYNEWRIEDLIVLTREEHASIHHAGRKDTPETKEKRAIKLRGRKNGSWYKNEITMENKFIKIGQEVPQGFVKGRFIAQESIEKMSKSKKGKIPWNKGKTMSNETKRKLSIAHKGKASWNKGTRGLMPVPWNKGKTNVYSEETRKKISNSLKGNNNRIKNMDLTQ